jgi:hypothetical protein
MCWFKESTSLHCDDALFHKKVDCWKSRYIHSRLKARRRVMMLPVESEWIGEDGHQAGGDDLNHEEFRWEGNVKQAYDLWSVRNTS